MPVLAIASTGKVSQILTPELIASQHWGSFVIITPSKTTGQELQVKFFICYTLGVGRYTLYYRYTLLK